MDHDINSYQSSHTNKHAMSISGNGSESSISTHTFTDISTPSTGSTSCNSIPFINGFTNSRRLSSADASSLPRVHTARRSVVGLHRNESQPDLINSHPQQGQASLHSDDHDHYVLNGRSHGDAHVDTHPDHKPECTTDTINKKDVLPKCRLSAPGKSFSVNSEIAHSNSAPEPLPVVSADKLRPYSPSLITVVKEGPSQDDLSSASSEQELLSLQGLGDHINTRAMVPEQSFVDSNETGDFQVIPECKCRVALEEHFLSSLEKCFQLKNQMEATAAECARWEGEAEGLRVRVQELEMELATRSASLQGLKAKVAEQHVQCAEVADQKRRAERDVKALQSKLDGISKSEQWYREQLHLCQVERSGLKKEALVARQEADAQRQQCERQANDLRRMGEQLRLAADRVVWEKKSFTRQLETALLKQGSAASHGPMEAEDSHTVTELRQVVSDLQVSLKSSSEQLTGATGETDRLLRRTVQLQQELCDTRVQLQLQQEAREAAEVDRDAARAYLKSREELVSQLSSENTNLAVQLECATRDRAEVTDAMDTLTRNFTNVSNKWRTMKEEQRELTVALEAARESARMLGAERDALANRVESSERREQALVKQVGELEAGVARASRLEHEVLALRESLNRSRTDAACLETAQRSAVVLEKTASDLERRNGQLRGQVEGLSQLLQVNTGSRISEDPQQLQHRARVDQLQAENMHLRQQVSLSAGRLTELSRQIESLEAEMEALRQQGDPRTLREELREAGSRLGAQAGELQQLRDEKASLQRAKQELAERSEQLASWLQALTDGAELGRQHEARQRALDNLTVTPLVVESTGGDGQDTLAEQLQAFREANAELALHAEVLQRRLDVDLDVPPTRPDLLQPAGAESPGRGGDLRCLTALLRVCLLRARDLSGHTAPLDWPLGAVEGEVERQLGVLAALSCHLDSALQASGVGAETGDGAVEGEEVAVLQTVHPRRDQMVRALLALVEENTKARKEAEERVALLQSSPAGDGNGTLLVRVTSLEQELTAARRSLQEVHKQVFSERRESLQLRKEVASLRVGLDTANDMLDNNKIALGRSESYTQVLQVSKEQVEMRLESEQREHEECRARLEQLAAQLQEAHAKDPMLEAQIKSLGCHLHQRAAEVRALQERLELRDAECAEVRAELERQRVVARREYEALLAELQRARQDFSQILCEMRDAVPKPEPCDEEGLSALIQKSSQLSPFVLDDLKNLLHNLKADLATIDKETGAYLDNNISVVQHV